MTRVEQELLNWHNRRYTKQAHECKLISDYHPHWYFADGKSTTYYGEDPYMIIPLIQTLNRLYP